MARDLRGQYSFTPCHSGILKNLPSPSPTLIRLLTILTMKITKSFAAILFAVASLTLPALGCGSKEATVIQSTQTEEENAQMDADYEKEMEAAENDTDLGDGDK